MFYSRRCDASSVFSLIQPSKVAVELGVANGYFCKLSPMKQYIPSKKQFILWTVIYLPTAFRGNGKSQTRNPGMSWLLERNHNQQLSNGSPQPSVKESWQPYLKKHLLDSWIGGVSNNNTGHGSKHIILSKGKAYATLRSNSEDGQKAKGIVAGSTPPSLVLPYP